MKQKSTKKHFKERLGRLKSLLVVAIAVLLVTGSSVVPNMADAASVDQQIAALRAENTRNRAAVADLVATARSYQEAINKLEGEINQLQGQIDVNIAEQNRLQAEIENNERELERQRQLLGADIKAMYTDGNVSTIEMLATSKDLSEFIDKETYRNVVQEKIQDTLKKITKLQAELKDQKARIEELLAQQQQQQASLNASRIEQSRLLGLNKAQQAEFNKQTSANQARIDQLIAQQRRANEGTPSGWYFIRFPGAVQSHDVGIDDYPYRVGNPDRNPSGFSMADAPCLGPPRTPDSQDRWGYCTRQCVSYAAWAVERSGRGAPRYYGSAKYWINSAPASWIHRDPQPGDVAITVDGYWGHAMYVEQVSGNQIYISEYNNRLTGEYNYRWRTFR